MEIARACYSVSKLKAAADMVKAINWSVNRKNEHFSKCMEIEKIYQFAAENLNAILFDPDIALKQYRNASYNYKAYTGKELNSILKTIYHSICFDLTEISNMIRSGEVDYCE